MLAQTALRWLVYSLLNVGRGLFVAIEEQQPFLAVALAWLVTDHVKSSSLME